jgi:hypothetical protein
MWETHDNFSPKLQESWNASVPSHTIADLNSKLSSLASDLTSWGKETFGSVQLQIRVLQQELNNLRSNPARVEPSFEEKKIVERLAEVLHREEVMWRQRSRVQWLAEGDKNTRFFHLRASQRKKKNRVSELLMADGTTITDESDMGRAAHEFYHQLYSAEDISGLDEVLDHVPRKVLPEMNEQLDRPFSNEEVKAALFEMYPTKAPGPDGFPAHFFQRNWEVCGEEVTRAVLRVLRGQDSPECINKTFIVPIPKVASPKELGQFRPISLCNVIYKIASKVVANRLKVVLPEIISEEQSAFVPGRLITDNIITAYECLHFMKRNKAKKHRFCALKLDMRKAYDRVEWKYLEEIMLKLGFSRRWVTMVMRLVTSVSFSVLFNGVPREEFRPTRGIRQGDPISPYLFLLAAEGLSCLLKNHDQSSALNGVQVASTAPAVNHLLFADDSLLFFKANAEGAREVKEALAKYCNASGQRINTDKSSIFFSRRCPEGIKGDIKAELDVQRETLNEKYLGMPADVGRSKSGAFKYLKDRVWKKVLGWLEQLLSVGGKEILIKSVAQAIPTFSMSCFKLPKGLCEHINSMLRKFWWGCKDGARKTCWVSWEKMTQPKFAGGLGFRDIELFNLALLARQAWRILQEPDTLSARVLKAVYFPSSTLLEAELGGHPSQVWRAIVEGRDALRIGLIRRIGDGRSTDAWTDNWLPRDERLIPVAPKKDEAPRRVCDYIIASSAAWDSDKIEEFFLPMDAEIIQGIPLCTRIQDDFWAWHFEKSGIFSVRSAYRALVNVKRTREDWIEERPGSANAVSEGKMWTKLWKCSVPSKVRVFLWRLAQCSLPTGDIRHHRGMAPSPSCSICGMEDSWRHSLIDCTMSRCIWALSTPVIAEHVSLSTEPSARQWLFSMFESMDHDDLTRMIVTLWSIWHARRKLIHEDIQQSPAATHAFIDSFLRDLGSTSSEPKEKKGGSTIEKVRGWLPPPADMCKVNVDGAVARSQQRGAVGAVCRSRSGAFQGASAVVFEGITHPGCLEALACREGVALATDLNMGATMVASDCLEVVQGLRQGKNLGLFSHILQETEAMAKNHGGTSFCHEGRRFNVDAHKLARLATTLPVGRHVWFGTPPEGLNLPVNIVPIVE